MRDRQIARLREGFSQPDGRAAPQGQAAEVAGAPRGRRWHVTEAPVLFEGDEVNADCWLNQAARPLLLATFSSRERQDPETTGHRGHAERPGSPGGAPEASLFQSRGPGAVRVSIAEAQAPDTVINHRTADG